MQNMQVVLIIERFVATVLVDTYETLYQSLGTVLVTILILVTTVEVGIGYETLFANVLMTNSMLHSDVKSNAVTITFIVISIISCLSLFITFSLYCYNSRREKRKTLTSRYQTLENISMSALLCIISVIQLVTFAIYASSMTYLRMRLMDHPLLDAYKELAYLVPLNTFLIPIGTLIFFKVSKRNRRYASINLINMKTQGDEGWQNYSKLLNRQWK
ncbi:hypothetical protein DICVIV_06308 [Dictyocaulus viviparus]|uniref:Serpentine receptor class gamma n=1 Tax=Dictyocaulus viviparus TaxID=29172 RepID=A0A0D8XZ18_DICVI|nr:hypothetical protein DICVIV_06308 [Dictyocaulus viviparus]